MFQVFQSFRGILQVFHADIAKVDQDVAFVATIVYICCKLLFASSVFPDVCCKHVYLDVAYISHICYKCFIWMLRMFTMVFKCFSCVFASVSYVCFKCFIRLTRMSQVLHLNISKVDRMLYLSPRFLLAHLSVSSQRRLGIRHRPSLLDVGDVRPGAGPLWARETNCKHGRPDAPSIQTSER